MAPVTYTLVGVAAIAGLVVLSAFFSSSETAVFTLTDEWVAEEASLGDARIAVLQDSGATRTASSSRSSSATTSSTWPSPA